MEKNETDGESRGYGGEERGIQGFGGEVSWNETTWKPRCRRDYNGFHGCTVHQ